MPTHTALARQCQASNHDMIFGLRSAARCKYTVVHVLSCCLAAAVRGGFVYNRIGPRWCSPHSFVSLFVIVVFICPVPRERVCYLFVGFFVIVTPLLPFTCTVDPSVTAPARCMNVSYVWLFNRYVSCVRFCRTGRPN